MSAAGVATERNISLYTLNNQRLLLRAKYHRGIHKDYVFTYRGNPVSRLHNSAWKRAWKKVKLPTEQGILKGVHNLRHTFGRRLRGTGISLETRKALLGHSHGDITTHYSAAELRELFDAVETIVDRGVAQSPTLTLVSKYAQRNAQENVGKLSEMEKGSTVKHG